MTVAIALDGVLRTAVGGGPIENGTLLYHGLNEVGKIAVLCDDDLERDQHWLKINGFTTHPYTIGPDIAGLTMAEKRLRQVKRLRNATPVTLVIESDPEVARHLYENGIPVLLQLHPQYSRPEHRPDYRSGLTSWDLLVAEVDRQRELAAKDTRGSEIL